MEIGIRGARAASGGTNPVMQLRYTLNGQDPWTNVGSPITVSNFY